MFNVRLFMPPCRWMLRTMLPLALLGVLLALAPVAVALEVHHELGAADGDGHQHTDNDICQWVQQHTGTSEMVDGLAPAVSCKQTIWAQPTVAALLPAPLQGAAGSRAPPRS